MTVEAALIQRAQRGDLRSFDTIVDRCHAWVYNVALRLLGDADQAGDATQEAFVRAFTALPSFRLDSSFTTWIYRVVTNVCLDRLRRQQRGPFETSLTPEDEDGNPGVRDVPNGSPGPAGRAEQHERVAAVHAALQRLSAEHRAIIVLFDLHGLAYQEVARALDLPLGTVKSRLNRARLALRAELQPCRELFEK